MANQRRTILVTGDAVCDHNYYRGNRQSADSPEQLGVREKLTGGGALFLQDIVTEALKDLSDWSVALGIESTYEALPKAHHAYRVWEPQIANPNEKDEEKQVLVWRAVEPPLGYGHPDKVPSKDLPTEPAAKPVTSAGPVAPTEIVLIDDAGLEFCHGPYKQAWPFAATKESADAPPWVVLKLSGTSLEGDLWRDVIEHFKKRLVVIVSADDLRRRDVRIGRGLSWEATAADLSSELQGNPLLTPLATAPHLIVTFGSDGAYWLDNHEKPSRAMLVFDAARAEGEWAGQQGKGGAFGFLSCFTAAVVRGLCLAEEQQAKEPDTMPDFEGALAAGLHASRECRRRGHGTVYVPDKRDDDQQVTTKDAAKKDKKKAINEHFGFPVGDLASRIREPKDEFASAPIPRDIADRGQWMMLDEWHLHARKDARMRPHFEAALAVAVSGPGALERFPVARFGDLQTVDRKEIENLRTISQLIEAYERGGRQKRPLSLGVFGPPGAGKSFGVSQIAKAILGIEVEDILTFNLSQFNEPSDLNGAFHQVRDEALSGRTPVVFWDEFDSQGYKWLQYLLAPMQDGAFQEGQITHPIGKCVFIFAGATSPTFDAFGPRNPIDVTRQELEGFADIPAQRRHIEQQWLDFVLKKGPDFKSRIVAYLDVLGPNPRLVEKKEGGGRRWDDDPTDVCYPIRRALFIRSQFKLKDPTARLRLDRGVLQSLLEVPKYKSGARSLEYLCTHLRQHATGTPTRSSLPGSQLLDLHVDAAAFWSICERDADFIDAAKGLARELHEDYVTSLTDTDRANPNNKPWDELPADIQESNEAQAGRIPRILALVGLRVVRGKPLLPAEEDRMRQTLRDNAEVLAEAEHNHWMVERMLTGWRYRRARKDEDKHHNWLIPYAQLPHIQKQKDLRVVRGQPEAANAPEVKDYIDRVKRIGFHVERIT